jgi:hypothetical protein
LEYQGDNPAFWKYQIENTANVLRFFGAVIEVNRKEIETLKNKVKELESRNQK